ncbi:MAG: nucleotide exchange factor GrpE [Prosthecobacter sp.]|nr:nucleotide exchange factor GrpE [Prosthecobacter sp.]
MTAPHSTSETQTAEPPAEDLAAPAPDASAPKDPLEICQQEAANWKDLAYRNAAELDNFRKRAAKEAQDTRAYANADVLRSLFPILDTFEVGLEAARAESEKSMIFMGLSMVLRQFQDLLRDHGVQEVEALGKPFDPNIHEAVSQEASATVAEGTVLRVLRRGHKLKDRLLRPATVVVSSGPPSA